MNSFIYICAIYNKAHNIHTDTYNSTLYKVKVFCRCEYRLDYTPDILYRLVKIVIVCLNKITISYLIWNYIIITCIRKAFRINFLIYYYKGMQSNICRQIALKNHCNIKIYISITYYEISLSKMYM